MLKHLVVYTNRPCWWCGARLSLTGQKTVTDILGNKLVVHRSCEEEALEYHKRLTAHPRLRSALDPG